MRMIVIATRGNRAHSYRAGHARRQQPPEPARLDPARVAGAPAAGGGPRGRLPDRQGATWRRGRPRRRRPGRVRRTGGAAARVPGRENAGAAAVQDALLLGLHRATAQRRQERSDDGCGPSGLHPEPEPAVPEEPAGSSAAPVRERPEAVIPRKNRVQEAPPKTPRTAPAAPLFSPARHGPFLRKPLHLTKSYQRGSAMKSS